MDDLVKQKNRELCERYPFLIPWNRWSGTLITDAGDGGFYPGDPETKVQYDWEFTELDSMPTGWRKAFGEQMCEEIRQALIEDGDLDRWRIVQLKEKYGATVCAVSMGPPQAEDVLKKARVDAADIAAVGLSNQRETTAAWDLETGKPIIYSGQPIT